MHYLEALRILHTELQPNNYCEVGCEYGMSLGLAKCRSIAIDPDFVITHQLEAPTSLYKMTSDEFFKVHSITNLLGEPLDLAFIDGMHKAEFALRDFMNLEKNSHRGTVIIFDDVLPQKFEWASRERTTVDWTGDVYKIIAILKQYRPDLEIQIIDVDFKGLGIITNTDYQSNVLFEEYTRIEKDILSDTYSLNSVEDIRIALKPIAIKEFSNLVKQIKEMRMLSAD